MTNTLHIQTGNIEALYAGKEMGTIHWRKKEENTTKNSSTAGNLIKNEKQKNGSIFVDKWKNSLNRV